MIYLLYQMKLNSINTWQRSVYNPDINNPALKKILSTFRENKIFYASDLCGTDFKQAIDFEILEIKKEGLNLPYFYFILPPILNVK